MPRVRRSVAALVVTLAASSLPAPAAKATTIDGGRSEDARRDVRIVRGEPTARLRAAADIDVSRVVALGHAVRFTMSARGAATLHSDRAVSWYEFSGYVGGVRVSTAISTRAPRNPRLSVDFVDRCSRQVSGVIEVKRRGDRPRTLAKITVPIGCLPGGDHLREVESTAAAYPLPEHPPLILHMALDSNSLSRVSPIRIRR